MKKNTDVILPGSTIGIINGGQLGKMLVQAAHTLGYHTAVWVTPGSDSPASEMATHRIVADFTDPDALVEMTILTDVVTTEWENTPVGVMDTLALEVPVRPDASVLEVAQSRWIEKVLATTILNIPITATLELRSLKHAQIVEKNNYADCLPGVIKTVSGGYDGIDQEDVENYDEVLQFIDSYDGDAGFVLEKCVDIDYEISVVVAQNAEEVICSRAVRNHHQDKILRVTEWWENCVPPVLENAVQTHAIKIAKHLNLHGTLAVEFFVTKDGKVLFNEMAPRPHNSFHGSIEAAYTSQYEQQICAACNLPLGNMDFHTPFQMINLIGDDYHDWEKWLKHPQASVHLYGKKEIRPDRKMGHVTILNP